MEMWSFQIVEPDVAEIDGDGNAQLPADVRCRKDNLADLGRLPMGSAYINAFDPQLASEAREVVGLPAHGRDGSQGEP
jgi:hypothetical protein